MSNTTLDETRVKQLFKEALVELVQERREMFYDLLAEVVEDGLLVRAIKEGEDSPPARREDVLRILEAAS